MKANKDEFSIKDLIGLFLPKLWLIAIVALVFALVLGAYAAFIKADTYTSKATLMVSKSSSTITTTDLDLASKMVETYEVVIFGDSFLNEIIYDVKNNPEYVDKDWNLTTNGLRSMISLVQRGDTEAFNISVTTTDRDLSYAVAVSVSELVRDLLPDKLPYEKGTIYSTIIDPAMRASAANSKNVVRNSIVGFLAGAILSMVAIFVFSIFDVTIRDRKKLEDNFDIPVLGVIPRFVTEEELNK